MSSQYLSRKEYQSPRGKVFYWISPHADPSARWLVMLHGLTASHTLFDRQVEYFSKEYSILVWDAPGHGLSRPYSNFYYPNLADDLKAILDTEEIKQAVMIGQSMGGYVIQEFAQHYPDIISGFVGVDTCPLASPYYSKSDLWWLRQVGWMSMWYPYKFLVHSVAKSATYTDYSYNNFKQSLDLFDSKKELCDIMGKGMSQLSDLIQTRHDAKMACPVILLVGKHDHTGKVLHYCKAWNQAEGYPLHIIPDAAHNSNVDNPDAVNILINEFLLNSTYTN